MAKKLGSKAGKVHKNHFLLLTFLLTSAGCGYLPLTLPPTPTPTAIGTPQLLQDYNQALKNWQAQPLHDYQITVIIYSQFITAPCDSMLVLTSSHDIITADWMATPAPYEIINGQKFWSSQHCSDYTQYAIPAMLDHVGELLQNKEHYPQVIVEFDPNLGYVKFLDLSYGAPIADIKVSDFHWLK